MLTRLAKYRIVSITLVFFALISWAKESSVVEVDLYVNHAQANRMSKAVANLTFINPKLKYIQDDANPHYTLEIDALSKDKAAIIATALRERLHLNPKIISETEARKPPSKREKLSGKVYEPKEIAVSNVGSHTSIIPLKLKAKNDVLPDDNFADSIPLDEEKKSATKNAAAPENVANKPKEENTTPHADTPVIAKNDKEIKSAPRQQEQAASTEDTPSQSNETPKTNKIHPAAKVSKAPITLNKALNNQAALDLKQSKFPIAPENSKGASAQLDDKAMTKRQAATNALAKTLGRQAKQAQKETPVSKDIKLADLNAALSHPEMLSTNAASEEKPLSNLALPPDHKVETKTELEKLPYSRVDKPKKKRTKPIKHLWNAKDADIRGVISKVSEFTGKNFIIDPRVQGKVTIISKTALTADEIYAAFLSALQVNGYSAVEDGDIIKIVPTIDAKSMHSDVKTSEKLKTPGDSYLVRVVSLKHVPVQQLIPVLRPLMPQWASLSTYMPSNKIILTGRRNNLDKLVKIIEEIDTDQLQRISIIPIQYGMAEEIAKTIRSLYTGFDGFAHKVSVASDDYSNSVLVSGAPADRERIKELIRELDNPSALSHKSSTQVINLKFLQAKDLVPILAGVAKSMFSGRVGTTIGSMTIENAERITIDENGGSSSSNTNTKKDVTASSKTENTKGESGRSVEIIAEPNTNTLIINGPPNVLMTLRHVIRQIDIRPAQVIVEALIAEIDENDVAQLGIDWGTVVSTAANVSSSAAGFQHNIGVITKHGFEDFQAILKMLSEDEKANILSTPSIMVLDNHKAHIAVGKKVSVENSTYNPSNNGPINTFEQQKVALALDVTPQINQGDSIRMLISHANNTLQNENDTSGRPVINLNEINTSVIVNNGDVLVLGGLIKNQVSNKDTSVPILGHLPLVGRLFHQMNKSIVKKKLMVFIHPIIIKNKNDNRYYSNEKYDFAREAQLGFMRKFLYHPENKEYVLPKVQYKQLPVPFSQETSGK